MQFFERRKIEFISKNNNMATKLELLKRKGADRSI